MEPPTFVPEVHLVLYPPYATIGRRHIYYRPESLLHLVMHSVPKKKIQHKEKLILKIILRFKWAYFINIFKPIWNVLEGFNVGHIIHHNDALKNFKLRKK